MIILCLYIFIRIQNLCLVNKKKKIFINEYQQNFDAIFKNKQFIDNIKR